jgi:hypothetical protein
MPSAQEQLGLENLNPDPGDRLPFALDMEWAHPASGHAGDASSNSRWLIW